MRLVFRAPVVALAVSPTARSTIVWAQRVFRAALVSILVFLGYVTPLSAVFHRLAPAFLVVIKALDLPIATAALVLPERLRPFSFWYLAGRSIHGHNLFYLEVERFLLVGVPAYVLIQTLAALGIQAMRAQLHPKTKVQHS